MKKSHIKKICQCFGKKQEFMKNNKCLNCQFKKRCLLLCNGKEVYDITN